MQCFYKSLRLQGGTMGQISPPLVCFRAGNPLSSCGFLSLCRTLPRSQTRFYCTSESTLRQQVASYTKRAMMFKVAIGTVMGIGGLIGSDLLYAKYAETQRWRNIQRTLQNGSFPAPNEMELLPREAEKEMLKCILQPEKNQSFYYLVTGEHGTGKTTLILLACSEVKQGVIYVDVPETVSDLGRELGKAIGYHFDENITLSRALKWRLLAKQNIPPDEALSRAKVTLLEAAEDYCKKNQKPPVLIIDNVNHLAQQSPEVLAMLQDLAKTCADKAKLCIVFVSSEGYAPRFLQSRSAWSRATRPPIEIGDVTDEEAKSYLVKQKNIAPEIATQLVNEIAGGRLLLLNHCADSLKKGASNEDVKRNALYAVESDYKAAGLLDDTKQKEPGWKLIHALLSSETGSITMRQFSKLIPDLLTQEALLKGQVFAYHPSTNVITFQSRAAKKFALNWLQSKE